MQICTQRFIRNSGVVWFCAVVVAVSVSRPLPAQPLSAHSDSAVTVAVDSLKAQAAGSLEQLIRGHAAGVRVTSADGAPGAAADVLIRGINFIKGSNQPLYVLDGVILNPASQDSRRAYWNDDTDYQMLQSALGTINPMDIERIEILKDAASTALWGSLGANGVVLITTRRGQPGGNRINWLSNVGISTGTRRMDMLGRESYLDYLKAKGVASVAGDGDVDWQRAVDRTAVSHNHYLSLSGEDKSRTSYMLSASFRQQTGVIDRTEAMYASFRFNAARPLGRHARMGTATLFAFGRVDMPSGTSLRGQSSIIRQSVLAAPVGFDSDAHSASYVMESPRRMIADYDDRSFEYRIIPSIYAEADLLPWLHLRSSVGIDFRDKKRQRWTGEGVYKGFEHSGMIGRSDMAGVRYNFDNTLRAEVGGSWGRIEALGGFSLNGNYFYDKIAEGYDLPAVAHSLRVKGMSASTEVFTGNYMPYRFLMQSAYGSFSYCYDERYFVTAVVRGDRFASSTPYWDVYPSVSAAWELGRERFMQGLGAISGLTLRAGWGRSGIKEGAPYRYFGLADSFDYELDSDPITHPVVSYDTYWHADLEEWNVGADVSFFDDRLKVSADYFSRRTDEKLDIIYTPAKTRFGSCVVRQSSKLELEGFEGAFDARIISGGSVEWRVGGNIFFNTAVVRQAGSDEGRTFWLGSSIGKINGVDTPATIFAEGLAPGLFYGFLTKGLLDERTAVTSPGFRGSELQAGNIRFFDRDGDGMVDDSDKTYIGDPNPLFSFGFDTELRWRNFLLSADFYGSYGGRICNLNLLDELNTGDASLHNVRRAAFDEAWTPSNRNTAYPAVGSYGMGEISSRIIEDASFLRCADITLAYDIPMSAATRKWIRSLRVSLSVKNAFVVTGYSGYDPEVNSFAGDISRYGFDVGSYPRARTFMVGVSASF